MNEQILPRPDPRDSYYFCMCKNKSCPTSATCYRFTAMPNPLPKGQSYANYYPPRGEKKCDYFKAVPAITPAE